MTNVVPFNEEEISKINFITKLPPEKQQEEWQKLSETLSEEQIEYLMNQQKGNGECLFCKIASGGIMAKQVYADELFVGVLDIKPAVKGHVLIFPRKHYGKLMDMEDGLVGGMFMVVNKIGKKMMEVLKCEGVNVYVANGSVAGQGAEHVIVHVIPRFKGDGVNIGWKGKDLSEGELEEMCLKLKMGSVMRKTPEMKKVEKSDMPKEERMVKEDDEETKEYDEYWEEHVP